MQSVPSPVHFHFMWFRRSGNPTEGRERLLPLGDHLFNPFGPDNSLVQKGQARTSKLSEWVIAQCLRDRLSEGGFGSQIWAAADRGDITEEQTPLIVRSLLSAGVDTTVNGLAAVLYAYATHPEEWARLRADSTSLGINPATWDKEWEFTGALDRTWRGSNRRRFSLH